MGRVLLVHPWIHDFAAHDFWLKPLGLLKLAGFLRAAGWEVEIVDCVDAHQHPALRDRIAPRPFGKGRILKEEIPKPACLARFPRRFSRYGIPPEFLDLSLKSMERPDVILMTSGMTYWYPGVQETIAHCRKAFPDVPIALGGIYATLCEDHARRFSGADLVVRGGGWREVLEQLSAMIPVEKQSLGREVFPAWDLTPAASAVVVRTSEGCPFRCDYCASEILATGFWKRDPDAVAAEIAWALGRTGAIDVAFYDDALLCEAETHLMVILEKLRGTELTPRFHCPNGLHARYLDAGLAQQLYKSGFATIRLGLESSQWVFHNQHGPKLREEEFRRAVASLREAGYAQHQVGAYILVGLPGQRVEQAEESIRYAEAVGARPYLAEYSPIPGTRLWAEAVRSSPYPLEEEPLFHNNTLMPCGWKGFSLEDLLKLKSSLQRSWSRSRI